MSVKTQQHDLSRLLLVRWLPDETLFSLCSRLHSLWGYHTAGETAEILFGAPRCGTHHDFPSGLASLSVRTGNVYGMPGAIAEGRTLLRFYLPFLTPLRTYDASFAMQKNVVPHLKYRLGLLTSQFRANHPLKACRSCMREDVGQSGWAYWHLEHQYPGVWVCRKHDEILLRSTSKSTGVDRFGWSLPLETQLVSDWPSETSIDFDAVRGLSDLVVSLVELDRDRGWLQLNALNDLLRKRLQLRGWLGPNGRFSEDEAAHDLAQFSKHLRDVPELRMLPYSRQDAIPHVRRIRSVGRSGVHPLRTLLAIYWLYGDVREFLSDYRVQNDAGGAVSVSSRRSANPSIQRPRNLVAKDKVLELLKQGLSATAAAKSAGVDVSTALSWAVQAGHEVTRRPKRITAEIREAIISGLNGGEDRERLASTHEVSQATIARILQAEPAVHARWKNVRNENAGRKARQSWQLLRATYPDLGNKLLRDMDRAAYAWLYRNDRIWLQQNSANRSSRSATQKYVRVNWDQRDLELSSMVRAAVLMLQERNGPRSLRLWQVYQVVPELKAKLPSIKRLPLTLRVLDQAVGRPSSKTKPNF